MARILVQTGAHLWRAPRVIKEADALSRAGHDVRVVGVWFLEEEARWDERLAAGRAWSFEPALDLRRRGAAGVMRNIATRSLTKIARKLHLRGIDLPSVLGYGVFSLYHYARSYAADLTIVHSEVGLWIAEKLLRRGARVGVDFEDWFSEVDTPEQTKNRALGMVRRLEAAVLAGASYRLTTSHVLAQALADAYHTPLPTVCYNVFSWSERERLDGAIKDRRLPEIPSLHWHSQTIGPDRGLEKVADALPLLSQPVELHLRGLPVPGYEESLRRRLPEQLRSHLHFHPPVHPDELLSRIAEHDVGLALESTAPRNRDLSVTNKFFEYLLAGLPVVATSTSGQREVAAQCPGAVALLESYRSEELAAALNGILLDRERLAAMKKAALAVARERFTHEQQIAIYQEEAARALGSPPSGRT